MSPGTGPAIARRHRLNIQLWSYNYDPEPTGIAPVSAAWAIAMRARGHDVVVIAAHPHYPQPDWGTSRRSYWENRHGIPVMRLPIRVGRASAKERLIQELSFTAAQALAAPRLPAADVIVAVSPSFPALAIASLNARARRIPWVLWVQDILPDGAIATGILPAAGRIAQAAGMFEQMMYKSARRVVVISETFEDNLLAKGVPPGKLRRIYNPFTRDGATGFAAVENVPPAKEPRLLYMGNIGHSQGLIELVRAFQTSPLHPHIGQLIIVGAGVAAAEVAAEIHTDRVEMRGLLSNEELEIELRRASVGVVTQRPDVAEFNVPSKLMNLMANGLPVIAAVRPDSEIARLVGRAQCGWTVDAARPEDFAGVVAEALGSPEEREYRGRLGRDFALKNLSPAAAAEGFEEVLLEAVGADRTRQMTSRTLLGEA